MAYDGRVLRRAIARFEEDRQERETRFQERRETIFRRQPRLRQIDAELRSTTSRIISSALRRGTDPMPALEVLRDENLSLQEEKRQLLEKMGLPQDCLENKPACALCGDSGYRGGEMCRCLRNYYAREQQRELSRMLDLGGQSFENFSLDWYSTETLYPLGISARKNMERVYGICREYAETFAAPGSGNLLLTGPPGLGKTFLSAAMAREVSGDGWSVVYDTAAHIFQRFEDRKFGREEGEEAEGDVNRVMTCDLLILDDLGTEMTTAFVQSALYQILNTRLMERRSTILSTNLKVVELAGRYGAQTASRIEGEYQILPFFGKDIRIQRKERE
ncbi:ATP-binding protein [Dysosmobacter sp.]|uniref:ATP-binding protein n=1 Tax=Dysosmobacter sp. TaxID=2591382 RepID=UPI002D7F32D3|nr:ATP-binding protein [Dysosmobacter sp.]MCI6053894.1 ATP-binding protein [Dysosmobacter sp.]